MDKQQRSRQIEILARENNWSFAPTADVSTVSALQKFEFQTGEKRKVERIENLIEGENFKVFDVYWQTEFKVSDAFGPLAHKNMSAQNARQQTMFLFEAKDLHLPKIHVYPANSSGWLDNWLDKTFRQTAFPSHPEFEKRWLAQAESKEVFNEQIIEFYEKSDEFWTFAVGNYIFIYQPNVLISPPQVLDWAERISTLAKLFGAYNL